MNNKYFKVIIVILFFMLAVGLALLGLRTPRPLPSSAARDVFSAERALEHVKAMAREPHPTGSKANDEVREYIVNELESLGLTPKIQTRHVTGKNYTGLVKNVIVVLPGREADSKDKLAIVSHYDSVESGPGASDDGAAVAAMLETLRVFKNLPQLKNDIVFLFTDGEELGLLGAEQFVNANPLAKDIAFLLNFEARGTAGPSLMFETSSDNGKLIKEFASTVPYPNATSLTYEIYKRMPNDTDFTVFKNEGIPGMNFAFIFEGYNYHTADDNLDNLKLGTIQHHGSYALALLKHFGDIDLKQVELKTENRVYFDIMGKFLIHYPVSWVIPFLIITALLFVFFVIYNTKKRNFSFKKFFIGLVYIVSTILAALLINSLVKYVVVNYFKIINGTSNISQYTLYINYLKNSDIFLFIFTAVTIISTTAVWFVFRRRLEYTNLLASILFAWLVIAGIVSVMFPGASYLFVIPLFLALTVYLTAVLMQKFILFDFQSVAAVVFMFSGMFLLFPIVYMINQAMGIDTIVPIMALVILPLLSGFSYMTEKKESIRITLSRKV